jgi:Cu-Zn family superoxide dismutase
VTRPLVRAAAAGATALALVALPAVPAAAAPGGDEGPARTSTYLLPGELVFPEGITVQDGFFYVSSTTDGTIFRGSLSGSSAGVFLPGGQDGRTTARGLAATDELLLVAGGPTGTLFVYDRQSGEFLGSFSASGAFVNDVRAAPNGDVYATDSTNDVVYRVTAGELQSGSGRLEVFSPGSENDPRGMFNANGLAVSQDGRYLVVVQSDTGRLFRISTQDRSIKEIDLGGATVRNGDGIVLQGRTLYVVQNATATVSEVRLSGQLTRGQLVQTVSDPSFAFPTTAALTRGRLLIVNSQFNQRSNPGPFTVSSLQRP